MKKFSLLPLTFCFLCVILIPTALAYTDEQVCNAIYIIEGKEKARQPYGVETIECKTEKRCRQICLNTIRNNRKRYADYGYKQYDTYLEFLQSRYCPSSQNLCENWLPNLKFYLTKDK